MKEYLEKLLKQNEKFIKTQACNTDYFQGFIDCLKSLIDKIDNGEIQERLTLENALGYFADSQDVTLVIEGNSYIIDIDWAENANGIPNKFINYLESSVLIDYDGTDLRIEVL